MKKPSLSLQPLLFLLALICYQSCSDNAAPKHKKPTGTSQERTADLSDEEFVQQAEKHFGLTGYTLLKKPDIIKGGDCDSFDISLIKDTTGNQKKICYIDGCGHVVSKKYVLDFQTITKRVLTDGTYIETKDLWFLPGNFVAVHYYNSDRKAVGLKILQDTVHKSRSNEGPSVMTYRSPKNFKTLLSFTESDSLAVEAQIDLIKYSGDYYIFLFPSINTWMDFTPPIAEDGYFKYKPLVYFLDYYKGELRPLKWNPQLNNSEHGKLQKFSNELKYHLEIDKLRAISKKKMEYSFWPY